MKQTSLAEKKTNEYIHGGSKRNTGCPVILAAIYIFYYYYLFNISCSFLVAIFISMEYMTKSSQLKCVIWKKKDTL